MGCLNLRFYSTIQTEMGTKLSSNGSKIFMSSTDIITNELVNETKNDSLIIILQQRIFQCIEQKCF